MENGPLRVDMNGNVAITDIAWTNVANMLYIEAPAGVGFSYSNTTADYNTNDTRTASDNYQFLQNFLQEYPQFQGRDTWVTGESYGGVYVPTLSQLIVSGADKGLAAQFKGFMVGNPVIGCEDDGPPRVFDIFYWHGLISYSHYSQWQANNCPTDFIKFACANIYKESLREIGIIYQQDALEQPSLDPDCLYQDFCTGNGTLEFAIQDPKIKDDCTSIDDDLTSYLNNPAVQAAIFARPAVWASCTNNINYTGNYPSIIPFYNEIFAERPDLKILVYSGDVDVDTVPFPVTQKCLADLDRPLVQHWQPWYVNGATAGYWEVTDKFTYATVKGAGHEAPQYQPLTAYNLFTRFLANGNLASPDDVETKKMLALRAQKNVRRLRQGAVLRNFLKNRQDQI
jgi:serine carboxypeptidase-like clade 2